MSKRAWYQEILESYSRERGENMVEPFRVRGMTAKQESTVRQFAQASGFETLRGFNMWMMSQEVTYYDILKWGSP